MSYKEIPVAETPKHTYTWHTGILRSHDIHIAVPNIDCIVPTYAKLSQGFHHSVWCRFLADILTLPYRNRYKFVSEEMLAQFLGCSIKLITNNRNILSFTPQF